MNRRFIEMPGLSHSMLFVIDRDFNIYYCLQNYISVIYKSPYILKNIT